MTVRPFKQRDLTAVVDIANEAWRDIYHMFRGAYGDELFGIVVPDETTTKGKQVRAQCERDPGNVFVCEEEGQCVGFATFRVDGERGIGEIGNNGVADDWRSKGIGRQMYSAVLEHFRAQGLRFAKVRTGLDEAHAPARRAYERMGFDIRHEDVDYYMKL